MCPSESGGKMEIELSKQIRPEILVTLYFKGTVPRDGLTKFRWTVQFHFHLALR